MKKVLIVEAVGFILCFVLLFVQSVDSDYIRYARVVEIQDNIAEVEAQTGYGDTKIYKIVKPFYKELKVGDDISINIKKDQAKYVIDREKIEGLAMCVAVLFCFAPGAIYCTYAVVSAIIETREKYK